MEEVRQYYRFRPDEIFRRVNITALLTLMLEQAKLEMQVRCVNLLQIVASQVSNQEEDLATMAAEEELDNGCPSSADSAIGDAEEEEEEEEAIAAVARRAAMEAAEQELRRAKENSQRLAR